MLRPIDIQNKEFEKKLKGYNCDEVDDFLDPPVKLEDNTKVNKFQHLTNAFRVAVWQI